MVYSKGYHPMPRVSFATALPVGVESLDEVLDLSLYDRGNIQQAIDLVNRELPAGITVLTIEEVLATERPPQVKESTFQVSVRGSVKEEDMIRFLGLSVCPVVQKRGNRERTIDIRSQVKGLHLLSGNQIELVVRHNGGPEMKPSEIIGEIFTLTGSQAEEMRVLKTKSMLA